MNLSFASNFISKSFFCFVLSLCFFFGKNEVFANEVYPNGFAEDYFSTSQFWKLRFSDHLGSGLGFQRGYSTLAGLHVYPDLQRGLHTLIDCRLHYLHERNVAGNFGIGFGSLYPTKVQCALYYDFVTRHKNVFSAITFSWQWITCLGGLHLNVAHSFTGKKTYRECKFKYDDEFKIRLSYVDIPYSISDFQVSTPFFCLFGMKWKFFAGGYALFNEMSRRRNGGVESSLYGYFCEGTNLEARWSYDPIFKNRVSIGLSFVWDFDCPGCMRRPCVSYCSYFPLVRNEITPIRSRCCWKWNYDDRIKDDEEDE